MANFPTKRIALRILSADWDDLTFRQLAVFLTIGSEEGPHRVRHLAERLRLSKPVVTRALNGLIAREWLTRHVDQKDGRDRLFTITRRGATVLAAMREWQ